LTNKETKRLQEIIRKQDAIKHKALGRKNLRLLNKAAKKSGPPTPKLQAVLRIRDRNLLQIALGTLSDRNIERYNALGVTQDLAIKMIETRPNLKAKYEAITLGLKAI
jgi:hypothetical protein